jgi:hypothetical protein
VGLALGYVETPIYLTSTMAVGRIFDGAVAAAVAVEPAVGVEDVVIPVVAECDDRWLNAARIVQVEPDDAGRALTLASAAGEVVEGAVGAGAGMVAFGYKGGIGTASRVVESGARVGVLLLANFGSREDLRVAGVPVGRLLPGQATRPRARRQLHRDCGHRRAARGRRSCPAGAPCGPRAGAHRLGGPQRQRRDLPGALDRGTGPSRRAGCRGPRSFRARTSTRSSAPRSRRPRRRC